MSYFETSASHDIGVKAMMNDICEKTYLEVAARMRRIEERNTINGYDTEETIRLSS